MDGLQEFLESSGVERGLVVQRERDLRREEGIPKGCRVPTERVRAELLEPFNPYHSDLDPVEALFREWFRRPLVSLGACLGIQRGVYALFYVSDMNCEPHLVERYRRVKDSAGRWPIYVGESDKEEAEEGIGDRCNCHIISLRDTDLGVENFAVKFLVLPKLINAERALIEVFQPAWNQSGFGLRPSAPTFRSNGSRTSEWDTLHPGREVAGKTSRSYAMSLRSMDKRIVKSSVDALTAFRRRWPELIRDLRLWY